MSEDSRSSQWCRYPGCTRPSRPDPHTGRPSLYCELSDEGGGPIHNRAAAWRARRSSTTAVVTDQSAATPVSLARATLEQQLAEFPSKLGEFRDFVDGVVSTMRTAGDVEAAGAEVEDAHREALTRVTEAERRASAAERAARLAEELAGTAQRDRREAEAVTEEALAETTRVRDGLTAELARVRDETQAAIGLAHDELISTQAGHATELAERDAVVAGARADAETAKREAAAAAAGKEAADKALARELEATAQLSAQLEAIRNQAAADRQQMQAKFDAAETARQHAHDELAAVRLELAASQAVADAARQAAQRDREAAQMAQAELETLRAEMRSERVALHTIHNEQIAQIQHHADQRVEALSQALQALQGPRPPASTPQDRPGTRASRKSPQT